MLEVCITTFCINIVLANPNPNPDPNPNLNTDTDTDTARTCWTSIDVLDWILARLPLP